LSLENHFIRGKQNIQLEVGDFKIVYSAFM